MNLLAHNTESQVILSDYVAAKYSVGLVTPFGTLISYEQVVHLLKMR